MGLVASLTVNHDARSVESLTRLGLDDSRSATEQLLLLSEDGTLLEDSELRLALVTALDRHTEGVFRDRVVRALIELAKTEPHGLTMLAQGDDLSKRARGAALFALARSLDERAVSVVVAHAAQGAELDPAGAQLARDALSTVPREVLERRTSKSLIDERTLALALGPDRSSPIPETPKKLVALAPRANSRLESGIDTPVERWRDALTLIIRERHLPREFLAEGAWREAMEENPPWALRSLAVLAARMKRQPSTWATEIAREALESEDEIIRSAGAWALSAWAPERAAELLEVADDPAILGPLLSQAFRGPLAKVARDIARADGEPSALTIELATNNSAWEPAGWRMLSSRAAWRGRAAESPPLGFRAALASRVEPQPKGGAPSVTVVRKWLATDQPELRAAVAWGLGFSPSGSAAGLLLHAYRREPSAHVRRALISAMSQHPHWSKDRLAEVARLDPDGGVRCRAGLTAEVREPGFVALVASQDKLTVVDPEGRRLWVAPTVDGFVGLVVEACDSSRAAPR